jgi:hypothetical protein
LSGNFSVFSRFGIWTEKNLATLILLVSSNIIS